MSFFNQGDFNIKETWGLPTPEQNQGKGNNNNNPARQLKESTPTQKHGHQAKPPTPDKSVLNRAAMALLTSNPNNDKKPEGINLDNIVHNRVLNNLKQDMIQTPPIS